MDTDVFRCSYCQHLKESIIHLNPEGAVRKHCCDCETDAWNWNTFFQVLTNHTREMLSCSVATTSKSCDNQQESKSKRKNNQAVIIILLLKNYILGFDSPKEGAHCGREPMLLSESFPSILKRWRTKIASTSTKTDLSGQKRAYNFLPGYIPTSFQAGEELQEIQEWHATNEAKLAERQGSSQNMVVKAYLRVRNELCKTSQMNIFFPCLWRMFPALGSRWPGTLDPLVWLHSALN